MVHNNTSSLVMDNLERLEMRRERNKLLEKAGLIYMVSERDTEDFERINIDFSKRRVGRDGSNLFYEKINRLVFRVFRLLFALTILSYLAMLRPGVLTILMSRVVPAFAMLYILRELIISGSRINARSKAIEHSRLELIKRLNIARTKLPVVPHADANEEMNEASDCLDSLCFEFVTPYKASVFPFCSIQCHEPCSVTIETVDHVLLHCICAKNAWINYNVPIPSNFLELSLSGILLLSAASWINYNVII